MKSQMKSADRSGARWAVIVGQDEACLLYTSDAADARSSVDLGGRRIIKKKKQIASSRGHGYDSTIV